MSLLFVDSKLQSEARVRGLLNEYGFSDIEFARSITQADSVIAQCIQESRTPRLIVIDIELEDGDGFDYCRQLRARDELSNSDIIVLVSSPQNQTAIDKALRMGATDFAVKPYDGKEFLKHLLLFCHRRSVLVVEDDPLIQQMMVKTLRKLHLVTIKTGDGTEAYNLINRIGPPRMVIMDIGLPGMSGVNLVQHIRTKRLWDKTPVVMVTASSDSRDVKTSLTAGANDYVVKPFKPDEFAERIKRIMGAGI